MWRSPALLQVALDGAALASLGPAVDAGVAPALGGAQPLDLG